MGFLHAGHERLIQEARQENDVVVVSIFVNPTQFGPREDFDQYPRDLDRDRDIARRLGVDILFSPSLDAMYPGGERLQRVWIEPGSQAFHMEGDVRPGHFRGVATVVAKLLHMTEADRAYFGQKDAQQAIIIRRMVHDLAFPTQVRVIPTVRDEDGLALSSRNSYLSAQERVQAATIPQALEVARRTIEGGERDPRRIIDAMASSIESAAQLAKIDYISVADLDTLQPVNRAFTGDVLVSLAVYFGKTRLIDNVVIHFRHGKPTFS